MENKKNFYEETWFICIALVIFAPLGIFLMWKHKKFKNNLRIVLSIIFGLFFIIAINSNSKPVEDKKEVKVVETVKATIAPVATPKEKTAEELKKEADDKLKKDAEDKIKAEEKAKKAEKDKYEAWIKEQFSVWDGSHKALVDLIKENLNDKKSFEHDKTTYIDKGDYITIKMVYRAKNGFGGVILQNVTAKADYKTNKLSIISQNDK